MADVSFEIIQNLGVLESEGKWKKELNIVKWGENDPKFDLRAWSEDHAKFGKGISLSASELQSLKDLLNSIS